MELEIINALIQAGIGVIALFIILAFIIRFPQNSEAIKGIVQQIRETTEAGIDRVEGANTVLSESVRMLQEVNRSALESRNRLEARFDSVNDEIAKLRAEVATKDAAIATLENKLAELAAAKDREIKELKEDIARMKKLATEKEDEIQSLREELRKTRDERDELTQRVGALERAQLAPTLPIAGMQEGKPDESSKAA